MQPTKAPDPLANDRAAGEPTVDDHAASWRSSRSLPAVTTSPLRTSRNGALVFLAVLFFVLTLLLGVAAVLTWIEDAADAAQRTAWLVGLAAAMLGLGLLLLWLARRPPSPTPAHEAAPTDRFERRLLGPAWTDWLGLALPPLIVGLPILGLGLGEDARRPLDEAALLAFGVTALLELLIVPAVVVARREWVALELRPEGIVVRSRGGLARVIPRGGLRAVRLAVRPGRNVSFGVVELDVGERAPIGLREPMTRELPVIARAVSAHMQAPLHDGWGAR